MQLLNLLTKSHGIFHPPSQISQIFRAPAIFASTLLPRYWYHLVPKCLRMLGVSRHVLWSMYSQTVSFPLNLSLTCFITIHTYVRNVGCQDTQHICKPHCSLSQLKKLTAGVNGMSKGLVEIFSPSRSCLLDFREPRFLSCWYTFEIPEIKTKQFWCRELAWCQGSPLTPSALAPHHPTFEATTVRMTNRSWACDMTYIPCYKVAILQWNHSNHLKIMPLEPGKLKFVQQKPSESNNSSGRI